MATKTTGSKAASSASKVLSSESTGAASKTSAGSALTQKATPKEQTSAGAATAASQVLRDGVPMLPQSQRLVVHCLKLDARSNF